MKASVKSQLPATRGSPMAFVLESVFARHEAIPHRYTCEGDDVSPPLVWTGAPDGTRVFALIVDDPDAPDPRAPMTTWVHWVLYDIPGETSRLEEGVRPQDLPRGAREGRNDWQRTGYDGPCPPIGRHRYFFKLFALDKPLGDLGYLDARELQQAMAPHVLARTDLVGTYRKSG